MEGDMGGPWTPQHCKKNKRTPHHPITQETTAPQIISFHRTAWKTKTSHTVRFDLQHRKLRFYSPHHRSKKHQHCNTANPHDPLLMSTWYVSNLIVSVYCTTLFSWSQNGSRRFSGNSFSALISVQEVIKVRGEEATYCVDKGSKFLKMSQWIAVALSLCLADTFILK